MNKKSLIITTTIALSAFAGGLAVGEPTVVIEPTPDIEITSITSKEGLVEIVTAGGYSYYVREDQDVEAWANEFDAGDDETLRGVKTIFRNELKTKSLKDIINDFDSIIEP